MVSCSNHALIVIPSQVVIIEFIRDRKGRSVGEKFLCGSLIPGWVWESYITIGVFTFGAACQQVTAEVTKYVLGRLRPHFYAVSYPSYILLTNTCMCAYYLF